MAGELVHVGIAGEAGAASVRIDAMPVRPDAGGGLRFAYPDFGADLAPALWDQLPLADRSGPPWSRRDTCSRCRADLTAPVEGRSVEFEIALKQVPQFRMELTLPASQCTACGDVQVMSHGRQTEADVFEALTRGMKAANVRP